MTNDEFNEMFWDRIRAEARALLINKNSEVLEMIADEANHLGLLLTDPPYPQNDLYYILSILDHITNMADAGEERERKIEKKEEKVLRKQINELTKSQRILKTRINQLALYAVKCQEALDQHQIVLEAPDFSTDSTVFDIDQFLNIEKYLPPELKDKNAG